MYLLNTSPSHFANPIMSSMVSDKSAGVLVAGVQMMTVVPPTQEDIESSRFDVYPSLQVASASNDIEFTIPNAAEGWLTDLSESYIKYSLTTTVSGNRTVAAANVYVPLPGLASAIFERASLTCNGTIINDETAGQAYLTHVMDLLNKSKTQYLADAHGWIPSAAVGQEAHSSASGQLSPNAGLSYPDYYTMPTLAASPLRHGKIVPLGELFDAARARRFWPDRCAFACA